MYRNYEDVPAYRRAGVNSALTLLGLICGPAILWVCIVVLTGEIYENKRDDKGNLKTWSFGNKFAAVIILMLQVAMTAYMIYAQMNPRP